MRKNLEAFSNEEEEQSVKIHERFPQHNFEKTCHFRNQKQDAENKQKQKL